mmetsp:Transcript_16258/g.31491  ORF Transcript_16258/g.31491 Transcript_16258/m.31491 type:complete len:390 (-) Transcript_16258:235-1404(-)
MAPNNALMKSSLGEDKKDSPETDEANDGSLNNDGSSSDAAELCGDESSGQTMRQRDGMITTDEVQGRGDGVNPNTGEVEAEWFKELRRALVATMFLTRLPMPEWVDHNPRDLVPGMMYFPIIGSIVGIWCGLWYEALVQVWSPLVAACASTLAGVWVSGCFHEDGLMDTTDAFGGGWTRDQILRIMKDSRCGTYAVVVMNLFMLTKTNSLAYLGSGEKGILTVQQALIIAHSCSRLTAVWQVNLFEYVHDEGDDKGLLYNTYAGCLRLGLLTWSRVAIATAYTLALIVMLLPVTKVIAVCVVVAIMTVASGVYATSIIGGIIGDFCGAVILLTEGLVYLILAADLDAIPLDAWKPWLRLVLFCGIPVYFMPGVAGFLARQTSKQACHTD